MVVVNFEQQIRPNTFEFTVSHLIDHHIDLNVFYEKYHNDHGGRSACDPAILLKIILFAYSKGIASSRDIQWECETNIISKALSCDSVPHFTSIAKFVSRYPDAIESVFEQELLVCEQQGVLGNELLAIDGCKMGSNASKEYSGTFKELKQKRSKIRRRIRQCLAEHKKLDGRKLAERETKKKVAQEAETLKKQFEKIDQFIKTQSPRMGQGKRPKEVKSNITDNESGKMTTGKGTIQGYNGLATVNKKHQIIVYAQVFGESQEHHTLKPILESVDARYQRLGIHEKILNSQIVVAADTGFSNEENDQYLKENDINAYIPDNKFRSRDKKFKQQKSKYGKRHRDTLVGVKSVIPSSEIAFNTKAKTGRCPEGNMMWLKNEKDNGDGKLKLFFEGKLTDCRQCPIKEKCMRNPRSADAREGHGRQVSITYANGKTASDWMLKRVDSELGKVYYGHRMSVVEPVFGNISSNKGLNRSSLRGKEKVQGQWRLFSLVHNIEKLMNYGKIA